VFVEPEETAAAQLLKLGIKETDVSTVVLSHFHADHVGGCHLFSKAKFVAKRSAWESVKGRSRWSATLAGFLPKLLPADFEDRLTLLDDFQNESCFLGAEWKVHDLFGDGSVEIADVPGHATGQIGLALETHREPVFFVADAAWDERNYTEQVHPHWLTRMVLQNQNSSEYGSTLRSLGELSRKRKTLKILPCHCCSTVEWSHQDKS
jgi:glyoxylase-like metal-dependent hydrolase (beta-lactamase superfamily II)